MELRPHRLASVALLGALAACLIAAPGAGAAKKGKGGSRDVTVMTRNLYVGADVTRAFRATTQQEVVDQAGEILNIATANNFPLRARALAQEIRTRKPDLVGLQEVSAFHTGPIDGPPPQGQPAPNLLIDYLSKLVKEVNRGFRKKEAGSYRVVAVEQEADIEAPANYQPGGYDFGSLHGVDADVRLTDRDVILARVGDGVKTSHVQGAHFNAHLEVPIPGGGGTIVIPRGWNALDANVRGHRFHLVNTHLEAADPIVRQAQAQEMFAPGGPATSRLPVVIIGDLNSDDDTVQGDDRLAYQALLGAGFLERTKPRPFSCCYQTELLTNPGDSFTHQVDHVITNRRNIRLVRSWVTGTKMYKGYWPSDHGGIVSELRFGR